jgi:hypothetical protein
MPKAAPEPEPEPMDIQEMAAEQERAAEPETAAEQEEQPEEEEEYEETITLRAADFYALQDTLEDIDSRLRTYRGTHTRIGSRPRTCCEPF